MTPLPLKPFQVGAAFCLTPCLALVPELGQEASCFLFLLSQHFSLHFFKNYISFEIEDITLDNLLPFLIAVTYWPAANTPH